MEYFEQTKNFQTNETYLHLKQEMKFIIQNEIEHYKRKVKYQTKFEDNELDISYYKSALKTQSTKNRISELAENKTSKKYSKPDKMVEIASKFYKELYSTRQTDTLIQNNVLKNINDKLSITQSENLDKEITIEEITQTIPQIQKR